MSKKEALRVRIHTARLEAAEILERLASPILVGFLANKLNPNSHPAYNLLSDASWYLRVGEQKYRQEKRRLYGKTASAR